MTIDRDDALVELRWEVAALRAELADVRRGVDAGGEGSGGLRRRSSRRQVLSGAALAGVAAALAGSRQVGAGNGDPLTLGSVSNVASAPTGLALIGTDKLYGIGVTDNGLAVVPTEVRGAAVFGHADGKAFSTAVGAYATGGHALTGVVDGQSTAAKFESSAGVAVECIAPGSVGLEAVDCLIGGRFAGVQGALLLSPSGDDVRATPKGSGTLDVDGFWNLWWNGRGDDWRKLAGPGTAGAFHPVTPGRVYDSRALLPATGALPGGGSRLVSVADRRNLETGAVVEANFVPAGATAVSANVTVVNTVGAGFVVANPGGVVEVGAATVNWFSSGQILNNGVIVKVGSGVNERKLTLVAGGGAGASTDIVIDITGYWL
jgi:hypothetical protein